MYPVIFFFLLRLLAPDIRFFISGPSPVYWLSLAIFHESELRIAFSINFFWPRLLTLVLLYLPNNIFIGILRTLTGELIKRNF